MTESEYSPNWAKKLDNWGKKQDAKWNKKPVHKRKGEFLFGIIFGFIFLYIINNVTGWFPGFFTEGWSAVLSVLMISITVEIIGNVLLLLFSPKPFYHLIKVITNSVSVVSMIVMVTIFPFTIPYGIEPLVKFSLVVIIFIVAITIIVDFFKIFMPVRDEHE